MPGRMKWCSSACSAVRLRRGSITTTLPPRSRIAAQAPAHVGRGQQAAVRRERVGAQHQQVVGAVDVRDRDAERRAEHQAGGHVLGHLVDGGRGEDVARAERLHERAPVEQRVEVVGVRVAEVDGDRVAPVLVQQRRQAAVDLGEGLVPRDLLEAGRRCARAACGSGRVLVQGLQREALGADEPVAEDVVRVAADRGRSRRPRASARARTSPRTAGRCDRR